MSQYLRIADNEFYRLYSNNAPPQHTGEEIMYQIRSRASECPAALMIHCLLILLYFLLYLFICFLLVMSRYFKKSFFFIVQRSGCFLTLLYTKINFSWFDDLTLIMEHRM